MLDIFAEQLMPLFFLGEDAIPGRVLKYWITDTNEYSQIEYISVEKEKRRLAIFPALSIDELLAKHEKEQSVYIARIISLSEVDSNRILTLIIESKCLLDKAMVPNKLSRDVLKTGYHCSVKLPAIESYPEPSSEKPEFILSKIDKKKRVQRKRSVKEDDSHVQSKSSGKISDSELLEDFFKRNPLVPERLQRRCYQYDAEPEYSSRDSIAHKELVSRVLRLPWTQSFIDSFEAEKANQILNQMCAGMDETKDRVLDIIAREAWINSHPKSNEVGSSVGLRLILSGPPGTGKTLIGRSIAKTQGKQFIKINVAANTHPVDWTGSSTNFIGAAPSCLLKALEGLPNRRVTVQLDEIDKLYATRHEGSVGALLAMVEPEQSKTFHDQYYEEDFDISSFDFIATANKVEEVHPALLDRFEVIEISAYTQAEQISILQSHLLPNAMINCRLSSKEVEFDPSALEILVKNYETMPGLRSVKRRIERVLDKVIREHQHTGQKVFVTPATIQRYLPKDNLTDTWKDILYR